MYKQKPSKGKSKAQNHKRFQQSANAKPNSSFSNQKKPASGQLVEDVQPVRMVMLGGNQISKKMKRQLKEKEESSKKQKTEEPSAIPVLSTKSSKPQGKLLTKHLVQAPYEFKIPTLSPELEESILKELTSSLKPEGESDTKKKAVPDDLVVGLGKVMRILQSYTPLSSSSEAPPLKLVLTCTSDAKLQTLVQPLHMLGALLSNSTELRIASLSSEAEASISQSLNIPHALVIGIKANSEKFDKVVQVFDQANMKTASTWMQDVSKRPPTFYPLSVRRVEIPALPPKRKIPAQPPKSK